VQRLEQHLVAGRVDDRGLLDDSVELVVVFFLDVEVTASPRTAPATSSA